MRDHLLEPSILPLPGMFGGYSDVAAYMLDPEVVGSSKAEEIPPVPPEYLPSYIPPDPWFHKSACTLDFILIAEFSEQEGPKPLVIVVVFIMFITS